MEGRGAVPLHQRAPNLELGFLQSCTADLALSICCASLAPNH